MRNALHHAAVSTQGIHIEIDHIIEAWSIKTGGHPATAQSHAHAVRKPLPERSRGRFDARGPPVLRMARTPAPPLPEMFNGLKRHRRFTEGFILRTHGLHT